MQFWELSTANSVEAFWSNHIGKATRKTNIKETQTFIWVETAYLSPPIWVDPSILYWTSLQNSQQNQAQLQQGNLYIRASVWPCVAPSIWNESGTSTSILTYSDLKDPYFEVNWVSNM